LGIILFGDVLGRHSERGCQGCVEHIRLKQN
jgi:hypothetical protein